MNSFSEAYEDMYDGMSPLGSVTLASYINRVYRSLYLPPETMPIHPYGGYDIKRRQSREAMEWLTWMQMSCNEQIIHARSANSERVIGKYRVDGYIRSTSTILEYNGWNVSYLSSVFSTIH